ncbi:relaxase/mobilization nuclease domain-containing protein [Bacteroides finegoldii]|uniref:relaxase/mobilization nuclease domain-containing protein n=1 Tax=Bacteroides finegoldii TaxID=338188 RepID=UPI001898A21A|nr:relaxase/mobilization nuclease domain-containing protein [Bacteroides finegoldii]
MIGKISKGATFSGCVKYVLGKQEARLLDAAGVLTNDIGTVTGCFEAQRMMKPHIRQPVGHISLSYAPEDAPRLTDEVMVQYAKEYMEKMGIKDTQYIIARHHDQKHPHVHIVFNRVDNNGRIISDRNDRYRNTDVCRELKEKHGLYFGEGKDRVRTHRLKGRDKTKYEVYHAVKDALAKAGGWRQFVRELERQGVQVTFKYKGSSDVVQGLSFSRDGITFKASEVDRKFSFSKLDALLDGHTETATSQAHAITGRNRSEERQTDIRAENDRSFSVFGGLFSPSNVRDEQPFIPPKKKKKKKRGYRL